MPKRDDGGRMTVVEHLTELRRRVIVCMIAITLGAIVVYIFSLDIIRFLIDYYEDATDGQKNALIFTGPLDAFATRLKVATYGGFVVALPVWLFQLWRFVTPGLHPKEKRYAIPFVLTSVVLFATGGFVAMLTLPRALDFLLNIGGSELEPLLTADRYLSMVTLMIVAFGVAFEFPVVLTFLLLARVISTAQLRRWRRATIVGVTIFAAVITPSQDPYSMLFMMAPMYLFYEICIIIGRVMKR
ncbi:MAG TPA: twin-arginine translocase subunit TatC [Acidimicrobiia bacterium]|nr:twin-arginine translocase subunit TatC [Acidimicrobiia bacterium]